MLILKLIIVPLAVLLLGITERVHGPKIAGWLSGFPVIAGPLLVFLDLDEGPAFAAAAALAAFFGLVAWLAFVTVYAWCARSLAWYWCALCGFLAWGVVAEIMVAIQGASPLLEAVPFLAAIAAILHHSRTVPSDAPRQHRWWRLWVRMAAAAAMTFLIAEYAGRLGSRWSGTFAIFPVVGSIVAISNHVEHGPRAVQEAVAGMVLGLVSVGVFCFAVFQLLGHTEAWTAFALALAAAMAAHLATWQLTRRAR